MDSVSDRALRCGARLIAHAYQDGTCPGAARLDRAGLAYDLLPAPGGTSEDVALLLAHAKAAEVIVLVGSHSNMIDFFGKRPPGYGFHLFDTFENRPYFTGCKKKLANYTGPEHRSVFCRRCWLP